MLLFPKKERSCRFIQFLSNLSVMFHFFNRFFHRYAGRVTARPHPFIIVLITILPRHKVVIFRRISMGGNDHVKTMFKATFHRGVDAKSVCNPATTIFFIPFSFKYSSKPVPLKALFTVLSKILSCVVGWNFW